LEQGLRREVEGHVGGRLRAQQEEILRVQSQISETLTGLAERLTTETEDDRLAVLISEHLRRAREQGMLEAAQSAAPARATSDMALLKAAVEELDEQRSQADILNTLVNRAAAFAPRVAFFVIKNDRATGWRARGLEGTVGDNAVREISLPLSSETALGQVARSRTTWSGAPGANADDAQFTAKLGDEPPRRMVAVPLVARDKCVAVLYADSAGLEGEAISLEALETLVRVAGMTVELLAAKRPPSSTSAATSQPVAVTDATAEARPAPAQPETPEPRDARADEPRGPRSEETTRADVSDSAEESAPAHSATAAMPAREEHDSRPTTPNIEAPAASVSAPPETAAAADAAREERSIVPVTAADSGAPATSFSAPLGASRRYGQQDSELPVEVSDEERRYHQDARRFARLLVSEIKLYNEQKVKDGRDRSDIYERLREEIDRSRQMYDKRVHPSVAPRYDYFHHELVATLAGGHADKLGAGYPGTAVTA